MAQHDYVIDNQGASPARTDLNNVLQAIMSMNSGATAPSTTVANMFWYDTANDLLKMRNEANTGWITLGTVNQSTSNFESATVNGKTVGTLTAAGGIAYATSTTALAAIGAGTSGQFLQSNAAAAPSWVTLAPSGGMTLLGTLTTTSGASQTLSSLTLTDYKFIIVRLIGVSSTSATTFRIQGGAGSTVDISDTMASVANLMHGEVSIELASSNAWYISSIGNTNANGTTRINLTSVTTAVTSITFSPASGTFDAGTIRVYGVK
jgi:hypothetical protein